MRGWDTPALEGGGREGTTVTDNSTLQPHPSNSNSNGGCNGFVTAASCSPTACPTCFTGVCRTTLWPLSLSSAGLGWGAPSGQGVGWWMPRRWELFAVSFCWSGLLCLAALESSVP